MSDFIFLLPDGGSYTDENGISTTRSRLPSPGLGYTYNSNNCGLGTAYGDSELKACDSYTGKFTCDGNLTTHSNLIVDDDLKVSGVSTFVGISTVQSTLFSNQLSVAGVSTFVGISTVQSTLFSNQLSVSGLTTSKTYAASGTTTSTDGSTSQPQIDARETQLHYHSASFNGDRSFQISYLTNGKSVTFYIRNTSGSSRNIGFQASATGSGLSTVELSGNATSFNLGSNSTAMVQIINIGGNFVGAVY